MNRISAAAAVAFLLGAADGVCAAGEDGATLFGARESVEAIALSPDGKRIAIIEPYKARGTSTLVYDLAAPAGTAPKMVLMADGSPERLSFCRWSSNSRLFCSFFGVVPLGQFANFGYVSRIVAVDADGGRMQVLRQTKGAGTPLGISLFGGSVIDWNPGQDGHVLMMRDYVPEQTIGTRLAQTQEGLGVDDVDTATLKVRRLEIPRANATEYISDGSGTVRIMGMRAKTSDGYDKNKTDYLYRKAGSREWEAFSQVGPDLNGCDPHAIDAKLDVAYCLRRENGRIAAYSVALDGTLKANLLFQHPSVDIDGFVRIGRTGRIIGVSYATDKREAVYFDPAMAKLAQSLAKALPKLPLIRFVDASQDESKLLLWAGSDTDPGRYFLFDRASRGLQELTLARPALENRPLATVTSVSYPARDGTTIPGYLTLPPGGAKTGLPALVMPHGGPGARDEWGFDWLAQYFAAQGYAVLQPNFRGSAGYGDKWFQDNGFKSWRTAIGDVADGGRWLVKQGTADPARLAVFGWSYGGYAALQSAIAEPGLFKAVVAVAPVTDLGRLVEDRRNWSDYYRVSAFVGTGPHIQEGSPARHASDVTVPVLMFHGTLDRNVSVGQSRLMDERLRGAGKASTLVVYEGLDHYLDDSAVRTEMLGKSAAFLQQAFGR